MGRVRRVAATLLLLSAALAASCLLLEAGVRLFLGPQVRFPRHVVGAPFGVRINEPGARYRHTSADVEIPFVINGQGLRADHDFPYEKPPGRKRIVSLGDSFTIGYEVPADQTFSAVLERELRKSGLDVEVLNAGVSGYSNAEAALYLERELLRYQPDAVLVTFFGNDLVDNLRTGLFALQDGKLVQTADAYVPAGELANFLNTNAVFSFLSEYSNAFALLKESLTLLVKRRMVEENVRNFAAAAAEGGPEAGAAPAGDDGAYQRALAAAIFERIYATTRARGIPLVIQSIPSKAEDPLRLVDLFPVAEVRTDRPGLYFFPAKSVLDRHVGKELLYYERSHGHWTPLAHEEAGKGLARLFETGHLLD